VTLKFRRQKDKGKTWAVTPTRYPQIGGNTKGIRSISAKNKREVRRNKEGESELISEIRYVEAFSRGIS